MHAQYLEDQAALLIAWRSISRWGQATNCYGIISLDAVAFCELGALDYVEFVGDPDEDWSRVWNLARSMGVLVSQESLDWASRRLDFAGI